MWKREAAMSECMHYTTWHTIVLLRDYKINILWKHSYIFKQNPSDSFLPWFPELPFIHKMQEPPWGRASACIASKDLRPASVPVKQRRSFLFFLSSQDILTGWKWWKKTTGRLTWLGSGETGRRVNHSFIKKESDMLHAMNAKPCGWMQSRSF